MEKSIGTTLHIIQAPADVIREIAGNTRGLTNHETQWEELMSTDEVELLETIWLEARSGQRARATSGRDYIFPVGFTRENATAPEDGEEENEDGATSIEPVFEAEFVGTTWELDPVLGADEWTIDINFSVHYDYALPVHEPLPSIEGENAVRLEGPSTRFHRAKLATQTVFRSGSIRMMGYWTPAGTEEFADGDLMQAAFLKLQVVRLDDEEPER